MPAGPCCCGRQLPQLGDALQSLAMDFQGGKPPGRSLTSPSAQRAANRIQARALAAGSGGGERYFLREWAGKGGSGRGVCFGISAAISSSSNQPGSCQRCPPAALGTLFGLEAPGCARNKTPCPLRGPSTSLHSSDNSSPVLLTLAAFPKFWLLPKSPLHQAADLGRPAWLSHPIVSRPGLSAGHRAPRRTFWAPELGTRRGEVPGRPFGGGCWGHEQPG